MEAVEILAREAGMQMPARDPQSTGKGRPAFATVDVMEQAVQFFRLQLKTGGGGAARDYLTGRGLTRQRWPLGHRFRTPGWQNLWDHSPERASPKI